MISVLKVRFSLLIKHEITSFEEVVVISEYFALFQCPEYSDEEPYASRAREQGFWRWFAAVDPKKNLDSTKKCLFGCKKDVAVFETFYLECQQFSGWMKDTQSSDADAFAVFSLFSRGEHG